MVVTPRKARKPASTTGRLIVCLVPEAVRQVQDWVSHHGDQPFGTLRGFSQEAGFSELVSVLPPDEALRTYALTLSVPPMRVLELERTPSGGPRNSRTLYWKLDTRRWPPARRAALLQKLSRVSVVRVAFEEIGFIPAAPVPTGSNTNLVDQGYVLAAPDGIGARKAWKYCDGSGIGFCDVEYHWNDAHEDLARTSVGLGDYVRIGSEWDLGWDDHGTAALGIVLGLDNAPGIVGIAPLTQSAVLLSSYDNGTDDESVLAAALTQVQSDLAGGTGQLKCGDILLMETQTSAGYPSESDTVVFEAVKALTDLGLIVVAAAGNAAGHLDHSPWVSPYVDHDQKANLTRDVAGEDSGSILVGAGQAGVLAGGHDRLSSSNFGARVDCYAWGEEVFTTGAYDKGLTVAAGKADAAANLSSRYTKFTATSAAAAIVAGAAILVQQMNVAVNGVPLTPKEMRKLLADPALGTKQNVKTVGGNPDYIGVMPDLVRIGQHLGAIPELSLPQVIPPTPSTDPFDPADVPFMGLGVIIKRLLYPVIDIQVGPPEPGPPPFRMKARTALYVNVRNAARVAARGVTARVYCAPPSPLAAPMAWRLIGESAPVDLAPGGATLAGPIPWINAPAEESASLIAVVSHPDDPPRIGPDTGWDEFVRLLPLDNNVAWQNAAWVDLQRDGGETPLPGVLLNSGDGLRRTFRLEAMHNLPAGARWRVDPEGLFGADRRLPGRKRPWRASVERELGEPVWVGFAVSADSQAPPGTYLAFIRQYWKDILVGQFTWSITIA